MRADTRKCHTDRNLLPFSARNSSESNLSRKEG
jgi:hypothetical protein